MLNTIINHNNNYNNHNNTNNKGKKNKKQWIYDIIKKIFVFEKKHFFFFTLHNKLIINRICLRIIIFWKY